MVVRAASSPSSSPVTIRVSSGGKGGGSRNLGLTNPILRTSVSNNLNSPLSGRANSGGGGVGGRYYSVSKDETEEVTSEYVSYTVHIPPTPDHQPVSSASQTTPIKDGGKPERSYISGTIFTGGFNSVTRGHVIVDCSLDRTDMGKSETGCEINGCDEKAMQGSSKGVMCDCGFKICKECYFDCIGDGGGGNGGRCPGCKEPYKDYSNDDDDYPRSEAEDEAHPLPSIADFADFKLDKKLSLVKSFKAPNHIPDFDHSRLGFSMEEEEGFDTCHSSKHELLHSIPCCTAEDPEPKKRRRGEEEKMSGMEQMIRRREGGSLGHVLRT